MLFTLHLNMFETYCLRKLFRLLTSIETDILITWKSFENPRKLFQRYNPHTFMSIVMQNL